MNSAIKSRPRVLIVVRAIVLFKTKILLIQRSKDDSNEANLWEFPGGKLDIGQDLKNAMKRELLEETGIEASPINNLVYYQSDIATSPRYRGLPYIKLIGLYRSDTNRVMLSFEHQDYKWVTFKKALDMDLSNVSRKGLFSWKKELMKYLKE